MMTLAPCPVATDPGSALLAHALGWRPGQVPRELDGVAVPPGTSLLAGDRFLMRTDSGFGFHYAPGAGLTVELDTTADRTELELWLNGSVYAAIAAIHGFLPFHASAIACRGRVYAFSGPSGAGKSTLIAALGRHGLPLFCDDTLVFDPSPLDQVLCLPGHKRLKLTDEAIALSGAESGDPVSPQIAKRYARPLAGTIAEPLPLAVLVFIEDGDEFDLAPITGAARIARLDDDHHTADFFAMARNETRPQRLERLAKLAARIPMQRLTRPRDIAQFADYAAFVADWIERDAPR